MDERFLLVIEDSDEDFEAVLWALRRLGRDVRLERCTDGDQAMQRLHLDGEPCPGLILLDLNLPGTDGREVLAHLKRDPVLHVLPVLVMSTSSSDDDVRACYDAGANGYLVKPVDFAQFTHQIRVMCEFWLDTAQLPVPLRPGQQ
ncbi:CheY-like chemotaxis protein [Deinococcus metalli]|uniref:CheY-like chemotaxis protein n=1 Tax=Deinococcus metalli TaxID=1141878 RepID=A0A7W8KFI5_9DEIO|nr:response regulator [Deinococcus metalli]MBB5377245.1 CheY-like chemotaxis protein [Deinococcus metalli]GHF47916.1 response regulator [Deinococcus metalli]